MKVSNGLPRSVCICDKLCIMTTLSFFLDAEILYTVHKSKLIRAWKLPSLESSTEFPPLKTDHKNPIVLIAVKNTRLITAAADSVIKVWHVGFRHNSGVLRYHNALRGDLTSTFGLIHMRWLF